MLRIARLSCVSLVVLLAACGGGGSTSDGGGSSGGGCKPESDAALCEAQGANCGEISVTDRCGEARTLSCGGCADPLWCGGGGEPNRCGATCEPAGCPSGYSCADGVCVGGDRGAVGLQLHTTTVSGRILLEGAAPVASEDCYDYTTAVSFSDLRTGASTTALVSCTDPDYGFSAVLTPGTWSVSMWKYRSEDSNLPDGMFVLEQALEVGPEGRSGVELDLRMVRVSGRVLLQGQAPQASEDCYDYTTTVAFVETTTGTSAFALVPCDSTEFAYALEVPEGSYDVRVSKYRIDDSNLPDGTVVAATALQIDGAKSGVDLDLRTVRVSGKLLLDGAAPVASSACSDYTASISFLDTRTGTGSSTLVPCDAADFAFEIDLPKGTYVVRASKYRDEDSNLPDGWFVVERALEIADDRAGVLLDLRTVPVRGALRWNGAQPVAAEDCYDFTTTVRFAETTTGASVSAYIPCDSADFAFEALLQPGTWAAVVSKYRDDDSNLPDGSFVVEPSIEVTQAISDMALDLRTVTVRGTLELDGAAPAVLPDCYDYTTTVQFRQGRLATSLAEMLAAPVATSANAYVPCGATDFAWSVELPPGDYAVSVAPYRGASSTLPDGTFVPAQQLRVE